MENLRAVSPPRLARQGRAPGRITSAHITHDSEQKKLEGGVLKLGVNGGVTVKRRHRDPGVIDTVIVPPSLSA